MAHLQIYRIDIDCPEHIKAHQNGQFGFQAHLTEGRPDKFDNVYVADGRIFITTSLLDVIGYTRYIRPQAKIGRTQLFALDNTEVFEAISYKIGYGCRNGREAAVRQRNQAIVDWLLNLL